jgi:hypothetical protein
LFFDAEVLSAALEKGVVLFKVFNDFIDIVKLL